MTNNEQQELIERLLGRLLFKNRDLKVTTYDHPEIFLGHRVLLRVEELTDEDYQTLWDFVNEHEAEDFFCGDFAIDGNDDVDEWDERTDTYTLILGGKAVEQDFGEDEVIETKRTACWYFGTIRHNGKTYTFEAKRYRDGLKYKIEEEDFSKLLITEMVSATPVLQYDRGWRIPPQTSKAKALLTMFLKAYHNA